jgi:hypothetical protein
VFFVLCLVCVCVVCVCIKLVGNLVWITTYIHARTYIVELHDGGDRVITDM